MLTGHVAQFFLTESKMEIDFVILDSAHVMPGEILDFLGVYPFLHAGVVICLHDISLNLGSPMHCANVAPNLLWNSIVAEKYLNFWGNEEDIYPNNGAFEVTVDTGRYIGNIFGCLTMNWNYYPSKDEMDIYSGIIKKHYNKDLRKIYEFTVEKIGAIIVLWL